MTWPKPLAICDEGVDYLTCTFNSQAATTRFFMEVAKVERSEISAGNLVQKWGMSGYNGHRCGGLEFGTSYQGCIVRLSGGTANTHWRRFGKLASNCSRIDVQQTCVFDENPADTISRCFDELVETWSKHKRFPKPKLWSGPLGAETVYSGERVSDVFLRCYHRGAKRGLEAMQGHIRFEAEFKGERAGTLMLALMREKQPARSAAAFALGQFGNRGVSLSWHDQRSGPIRSPKMQSTASGRLQWLEAQVRPTVQALLELGMRDKVLRALGICELPTNPGKCPEEEGEN